MNHRFTFGSLTSAARALRTSAPSLLAVGASLLIVVVGPASRGQAPASESKLREEQQAKQRERLLKAREIREEKKEQSAAIASVKSTRTASVSSAQTQSQLLTPTGLSSVYNYTTSHHDSQRTGWNSNETLLTPANVDTNNTTSGIHNFNTPTAGFFGELWNSAQFASSPADCWATPLYVDSVTLTGGIINYKGTNIDLTGVTLPVVYCATGKCDVYALVAAQGLITDAHDTQLPANVVHNVQLPPGTIVWHTNLGTPTGSLDGVSTGIFNTPIIDLNATTPTMYVTCKSNGNTGWQAYALDITNGSIISGWPVTINNAAIHTGSVLQNGPAIFFDSKNLDEGCRGALNLSADGSILYVPISDVSQVTGFMVTINTKPTPSLASAFAGVANAPMSSGAYYVGFWSADGASLDSSGNVYVCTGDNPAPSDAFLTDRDNALGPGYWGMTMLCFNPTANLTIKGTYNAWNYQSMDKNDVDIASTPVIIPDLPGPVPHASAYMAKNGTVYFFNRDTLLPNTTNFRPSAVDGVSYKSFKDERGLVAPTTYPYYTNQGLTPGGSTGPLNVFGPYTEGSNGTDYAKARTSLAVFQGPDNNYYLMGAGQTKATDSANPPNTLTKAKPPGVARLKINTFPSSNPYLTIDAQDTVNVYESAGSPVISSNGNTNPISWNLDANRYRSNGLSGSRPYLVAVDAMTMKTLYKTAVDSRNQDSVMPFVSTFAATLHQGGKYNEPSVTRGRVFVGTDRLQVFGVTSYVYAVGAGGAGGPGDTTTTLSPLMPDGSTRNVVTTTVGKTFTADAFVTGGTPGTASGNTIDVTSVSNPAPATVYQHSRVGQTGVGTPTGGFTYTFPNLTPGATYSVRLHFCETVKTGNNQRKFNVSINGISVLTNYDVFATGGAQNVAVEEPFGAIADLSAGTITVAFSPGSADFPMVSGIEINAIPNSISQEYWFDWLAQYGLLGAPADPAANSAKDGVANAWKYFTNASPNQHANASTLLPQMSEFNAGGGTYYLQFSYLRRIDYAARGFSVAVQTSPDLSPNSWTTQSASQIGNAVPTGDGVTETAVIRLNAPITPGMAKLFARVQLTLVN